VIIVMYTKDFYVYSIKLFKINNFKITLPKRTPLTHGLNSNHYEEKLKYSTGNLKKTSREQSAKAPR
jgi:hypothetical protein